MIGLAPMLATLLLQAAPFETGEKKLLEAGTFHARIELELHDGKEVRQKLTSEVWVGDKQRSRIEMKSSQPAGLNTMTLISDGSALWGVRNEDEPRKMKLASDWRRSMTMAYYRLGAFVGIDRVGRLLDKTGEGDLAIQDRMVCKGSTTRDDTLNGKACKVFDYTVEDTCGSKAIEWRCVLWLDAATGLPVKRTSTDDRGTWTEIYTSFELDAKIDPSRFAPPR